MMINLASLAMAAILLLGYVEPSQQQDEPCKNPTLVQEWTQWFDRDDPSGTGDWENLNSLRKENPGKICLEPRDIEAVTLSGLSASQAGDNIYRNDLNTGFVCRNEDQHGKKCNDYKVRFSCEAKSCDNVCWSQWYNRDRPSGSGDWENYSSLQQQFNDEMHCYEPQYIEAVTVDQGIPAISTRETFHAYSPTKGLVCRNKDQDTGRCSDYKVRFGCDCNSFCSKLRHQKNVK